DAVGIEAGLHSVEIPKAAQQKSRGDHEHKRQREFADNENLTCTRTPGRSFRAAAFLLERVDQIRATGEPRGSDPENNSGADRDDYGKHQNTPVHRDVVEIRQTVGDEAEQEIPRGEKNRNTRDPAE